MYARLVQYKLGSGNRTIAENLAKEFDPVTRTLRGFRGNVYFFDDSTGEYKALNYWDTKADAEKANQVMFPKLLNELKNITEDQPSYSVFEIYDPSDSGGLAF